MIKEREPTQSSHPLTEFNTDARISVFVEIWTENRNTHDTRDDHHDSTRDITLRWDANTARPLSTVVIHAASMCAHTGVSMRSRQERKTFTLDSRQHHLQGSLDTVRATDTPIVSSRKSYQWEWRKKKNGNSHACGRTNACIGQCRGHDSQFSRAQDYGGHLSIEFESTCE